MADEVTAQPVAEGTTPPADAASGHESPADLIAQGALELMRSTTPADDVEEPTDEDDADEFEDELEDEDAGEDVTDEDVEDEEAPPPPSDDEQLDRAIRLLASNPANLTQIPRKYRVEAIKGVAQMAYEAGREHASQQAAQQAQQQVGETRLVAELDALLDNDPEAFEERQRSNPAEAARYWSAKAQQKSLEEPPHPIQQQAERILSRLGDDREAAQRVLARIQSGEFPRTEQGLADLGVAVGEELAASRAASAQEVTVAKRRGQATQRRRALPKPVVGPSYGSGSGPVEDLSDTTSLLKAGMSEVRQDQRAGRVPRAVSTRAS